MYGNLLNNFLAKARYWYEFLESDFIKIFKHVDTLYPLVNDNLCMPFTACDPSVCQHMVEVYHELRTFVCFMYSECLQGTSWENWSWFCWGTCKMKSMVFWGVTLCSLETARYFRGTDCHHLYVQKLAKPETRRSRWQVKLVYCLS
jgi:hypothetical protein